MSEMEANNINQPDLNITGLIGKLKQEDERNLRMTNTFQSIMWVLGPLYFLFFIVSLLFSTPWYGHLGMFFFALAFILFAFIFRKFTNEYRSVDYGLPTLEMLTNAARRYKFWQKRLLVSLIPVLLVDLGLSFSSFEHFFDDDHLTRIIAFQEFYLPSMFVAVLIGYFIWRTRQKPLRDSALALLKEIEA